MKYSDKLVDQLIETIANDEDIPLCPNDAGIEKQGECDGDCKECWQKSLAGEDE
ncbi:MAG: hypothetical protein K0Q53_141 [Massilibacillus sp.]|jgi:hypothetical protein|nr:hypothetical protein [Massilibacillus sp.]